MASRPKQVLCDGKSWDDFSYDTTVKRIVVRCNDPRLHVFETVVREEGIDLGGTKDVRVKDVTVTNTRRVAHR